MLSWAMCKGVATIYCTKCVKPLSEGMTPSEAKWQIESKAVEHKCK